MKRKHMALKLNFQSMTHERKFTEQRDRQKIDPVDIVVLLDPSILN